MKLKENVRHVDMGPLHYRVFICITNNIIASREKRNYIFGEPPVEFLGEGLSGLHSANGLGVSYIFLRKDCDIGQITHESFHAMWAIMRFLGAQMENEICAYTITYLVREVDSFLKKLKTKRIKGT